MALNNVGADSATYITGLQVRTKYNTDLENVLTAFASASAPASPDAHMYWLDTSDGTFAVLKKRNPDNDAWIEVVGIHLTGDTLYYPAPFYLIQNSDICTITLDGTDCYIKTSDGSIIFQTDEGTNTDTHLEVRGKGTGKGYLDIQDQSATNKASVTVPDALGADVTIQLPGYDCEFPTADGSADQVLATDGAGKLVFATASGGGGGGKSEVPGTLMNCLNAGVSAAPNYMYATGAGGSITMTSAASKTDKGWEAQITNGAATAYRFGWNTDQNNCDEMVDIVGLRGSKFTMGAWVYSETADRVKLEVSDGTTTTTSTAYHAGGGWEWMTVTLGANVDAAATTLTAYVLIEAGDAITILVELPCVQKGTSCSEHVGYVGRGRTKAFEFNQSGSGTNVITGLGFSPTAITVSSIYFSTATKGGGGGADLTGTTISQTYQTATLEGTGYIGYVDASNNAAVSAFGSDGFSVAVTIPSNVCRCAGVAQEGNPV